MFKPSSIYRGIACPLEEECDLPNCLFSHRLDAAQRVWLNQPTAEDIESSRPVKRQRLSPAPSKVSTESVQAFAPTAKPGFVGQLLPKKTLSIEVSKAKAEGLEQKPAGTGSVDTKPRTQRPISPPVIKRRVQPPQSTAEETQEELNPRNVDKAPAKHQHRYAYLKKLHEAMTKHNQKVASDPDPKTKALRLTDGQLITLALDEEERIANENPTIYSNVIKMRIVTFMKLPYDEWKAARLREKEAKQVPAPTALNGQPAKISGERDLTTGLSLHQEHQILRRLLARQDGLEKYGYVTSIPSDDKIRKAEEIVEMELNWERCERCQCRFQVFPDRREEDGAVTTGGRCTYHHGRQTFAPKDTSGYSNTRHKVWSCCDEPAGTSKGCTEAESHVFKVYDCGRLASIMQFATTPDNASVPSDRAVTFDCEMGFTSKGMELLRLTAISWPQRETLLDVLVRPLGIILDLNTRYSGVLPQQFANANPYNPETAAPNELQIVDCPQTARKLLFSLISPSTPLIGHAIENDLNTTRIVHPCIIDTVLLFPHPGGLPHRKSLRMLSAELLWRNIQQAGAAGHDSKEDCIATGDLVLVKVKREWRQMKRDGWSVSDADGELVAPKVNGDGTLSKTAHQLQQEASLKRKAQDEVNYDEDS